MRDYRSSNFHAYDRLFADSEGKGILSVRNIFDHPHLAVCFCSQKFVLVWCQQVILKPEIQVNANKLLQQTTVGVHEINLTLR